MAPSTDLQILDEKYFDCIDEESHLRLSELLARVHTRSHIEKVRATEINWDDPMNPTVRVDWDIKFRFARDTFDNKFTN